MKHAEAKLALERERLKQLGLTEEQVDKHFSGWAKAKQYREAQPRHRCLPSDDILTIRSRRRPGYCIRGHARTPENLTSRWACKLCRKVVQEAKQAAKASMPAKAPGRPASVRERL